MLITVVALVCAILVTLFLTFGRFARSESWRATVTPLASIIGSGFLICGPILAREFGRAAIIAEAALLLIAYAAGAVIRFNIIHVENYLAKAGFNDPVSWLARVTQGVLALAYAISVAYYLKLLAEFLLKPIGIADNWHVLASNGIVTVIVLAIIALAFGNGLRRVEHLAHGTVSLKIGIIAGLLAGLACWWLTNNAADPLPPAKVSWGSIPLLLGLVITVQGFETSRYLGHAYSQELRIRTMRHAQWIAAVIYLAFLALLTPFLERAAESEGVAGILDIMTLVAPALGIFVLVGALSSQLSAAVADSIGSGGLMSEVTRRKLSVQAAFALAGALAVGVVWLTDPFQVVAISSRAFALFYALQCALALTVARRTGVSTAARTAGFLVVGIICLVAVFVGAPAEG
ncbi:fumarate reductase subunit D [Sphingomonas sp. UYAg733]